MIEIPPTTITLDSGVASFPIPPTAKPFLFLAIDPTDEKNPVHLWLRDPKTCTDFKAKHMAEAMVALNISAKGVGILATMLQTLADTTQQNPIPPTN